MTTDNITHVQVVEGADGTTTVVAGIVRGQRITQYIVRRLSPTGLDAFERDVETALHRGEDVELTIAAWAELEGG